MPVPSPKYEPTLFDRHGPDAGLRLTAAGYGVMVFFVTCVVWFLLATRRLGLVGKAALVFAVVAAAISGVLTYRMTLATADGAGGVVRAITGGTGSTPYEDQFSYQEAMAARGDVAGALASFEAVIEERRDAVAPRFKAAELYARRGNDPRRAVALFREVRDLPTATSREALYAALRLVDLYERTLDEQGLALVELRRLIERHPGSDAAAHAREAIARIKAERSGEHS